MTVATSRSWSNVLPRDRIAVGVVLALVVLGLVPFLGRRATSLLRLDPVPRDHSRCIASVYSETYNASGAPLTSGVRYMYPLGMSGPTLNVIWHEHDGRPAPPSPFERYGTLCSLLAAVVFFALWTWARWLQRVLVPRIPAGRAGLLGFGVGSVLALPLALLAGWLAEQVTLDAPSAPWFLTLLPPRLGVHLTVQILVVAGVIAWFLGTRRDHEGEVKNGAA